MTVDFSAVIAAEVHAADLVRAHDRGEEDSRWTVQAIGLYGHLLDLYNHCLLYTSPSPRDS